jgi:hypothetical protein
VARVICDAHTAAGGLKGFTVHFGTPPDSAKIDGDLYWEAWRVLRRFGELD